MKECFYLFYFKIEMVHATYLLFTIISILLQIITVMFHICSKRYCNNFTNGYIITSYGILRLMTKHNEFLTSNCGLLAVTVMSDYVCIYMLLGNVCI